MTHIFQAATADQSRAIEAVHRACIFQSDFIPVVHNGRYFAAALDLVREPSATTTAAEFVLNMEVLGVRFWIMKTSDGGDRLLQPEGYHMLPAHWIPRAEALRAVFPVERDAEAIAFMRQRGDIAVGEDREPDPILTLIDEYRCQKVAWLSTDQDLDDDDFAAEHEAKLQPLFIRLRDECPAATTLEGAIAAFRLVADEDAACPNWNAASSVLAAGRAYFERRASE